MEATKGRDLHKSLKLLIKECEKGLPLFIDFRFEVFQLKGRFTNHSFSREEVRRRLFGSPLTL
jgi:hypothetical protein